MKTTIHNHHGTRAVTIAATTNGADTTQIDAALEEVTRQPVVASLQRLLEMWNEEAKRGY